MPTGIGSKTVDRLILPYFVIDGRGKSVPIPSMPGVCRLSVDRLLVDLAGAHALGIRKVLLFGVPSSRVKDASGSSCSWPDGIVPRAVRAVKARFKNITVMTDVCLCAYTDHGHCGVLDKECGRGVFIDSARTLEALAAMAVAHASAGADWVAPSAMAKGQVAAVRKALDRSGHKRVKILGYSAKFASSFYGPFRDAARSAPAFGDRRGYQVDPANDHRALAEIADDIREGADMVMVKPALPYLDIIRRARERYRFPLAAYNVSGEYAMVKAGAARGFLDEKAAVREIFTAILRAGADMIISYHARDVARWQKDRP